MNAFSPTRQSPTILTLFRSMDARTQHKALQLLVREFEYGFREADLFLAAAASEMHPDRDDLQDALYPFGVLNMEASARHRAELEAAVIAAERRHLGSLAMMTPLTDVTRLSERSVIG